MKITKGDMWELFSALKYLLAIGWYGYIGRLIIVSNVNIFFKILLFIGCLLFGFIFFIDQHNKNN